MVTYQSYLEELREVIRRVHGVDSEHLRTVAVKESLQGNTLWNGLVEVFELKGHPSAEHAYAWADRMDDPTHRRHHVTILELPPIKSAQDAVRVAIEQELKNRPPKQEKENPKPEQPTVDARGRIVPVRFKMGELKAIQAAAKARNQTISDWIKSTIHGTLTSEVSK